MPSLTHPDDVGYDLYSVGDHEIKPGQTVDVPTGVSLAMPASVYGRITGRSSSIRRGLMVYEGILDSGYRGELFAAVHNLNGESITITHHERVAQLVFAPAVRPRMEAIAIDEQLVPSSRGERGFGSSGR